MNIMKNPFILLAFPFFIASCNSSSQNEFSGKPIVTASANNTSSQDSMQKEANAFTKKLIEERSNKKPVAKGDLFYCKVAINPEADFVDSGIHAKVKDNITTFGVIFSNGYQVVSPELRVGDNITGLRVGERAGGDVTFTADYDGANYSITTYDKYVLTQVLGGKYITNNEFFDNANTFRLYDCEK
ncbi:hypothetical protein [Raoultella planticola]|uniref:hypothetical protein n=1 Tax=Raoultella planticola TaxID=575 RepID=UPI003A4C5725